MGLALCLFRCVDEISVRLDDGTVVQFHPSCGKGVYRMEHFLDPPSYVIPYFFNENNDPVSVVQIFNGVQALRDLVKDLDAYRWGFPKADDFFDAIEIVSNLAAALSAKSDVAEKLWEEFEKRIVWKTKQEQSFQQEKQNRIDFLENYRKQQEETKKIREMHILERVELEKQRTEKERTLKGPMETRRKLYFVGLAAWQLDSEVHSDDDKTQLMLEACKKKFPNARPATAEEYLEKKIIGKILPDKVPFHSGRATCTEPGNLGEPIEDCKSKFALKGIASTKCFSDGSFSTEIIKNGNCLVICVEERD